MAYGSEILFGCTVHYDLNSMVYKAKSVVK